MAIDVTRDELEQLLERHSTREVMRQLGLSTNSYTSLRSLCERKGVEIPKRSNQHDLATQHEKPVETRSRREWRVVNPETSGPIERPICGIAVFDFHYPHHVPRLWENILRFTKDFKPDVWVWGGDNLTVQALDHWALGSNKRRKIENARMLAEYEGFEDDALDPLDAVLPPWCRRIWHYGNHEDWVEQYIDLHPEVEGFLEVEKNLPLREQGYEAYRYGKVSTAGKLHFTHGEYVNEHNAAKTVRVFQRNIVYGHGHTYQAFTDITPIDSEAHTAIQVPCACDLNPHYRENRPNAWLNGFLVFYVRPDGCFNAYPVIATDGAFTAPNGVRYE